MTPGEILAKMLSAQEVGENTEDLLEDLQKATCQRLGVYGTHVTCGDYEASNGGIVKKRYSGDPDNNPRKDVDVFHAPML